MNQSNGRKKEIAAQLEKLDKGSAFLNKALKMKKTDLYRAASIQAFEFTFELAWKLMKLFADHKGVTVYGPRDSIREAGKMELINNVEEWLGYMDYRNLTSHTYNEITAEDVYNAAKKFLFDSQRLIKSAQKFKEQ